MRSSAILSAVHRDDAAKAMWIKYEYPDTTFEDMCKVFGLPKLRKKAHFCAVSSTSGTATEVTAFSIITDYENAPFHTGVKAVPRPIGVAAHIADLRKSDRNDFSVLGVDTVKNDAPHTAVFFGKKLGKLFSLVCAEIVLIRHFLGGLVTNRDIQIGSCNGRGGFHNVPVAVVGFSCGEQETIV